ncbi:MAG TPA: helix-turn-helix domain-containing protein, partial [Tepidisphaeraceae bacterium]|nr:helix-turn-helix domain-containing protein [Tepidisphaeraceae bacterium]
MEPLNDPESSKPSYGVAAVARACDILSAFRQSDEALRLQQIADRTSLHKVTVYRILATLVDKGLIERVGAHTYRPRFQPMRSSPYRIGYAALSAVVPFISTVSDALKVAAHERNIDLIVLN